MLSVVIHLDSNKSVSIDRVHIENIATLWGLFAIVLLAVVVAFRSWCFCGVLPVRGRIS